MIVNNKTLKTVHYENDTVKEGEYKGLTIHTATIIYENQGYTVVMVQPDFIVYEKGG